jgi:glycosyltransferase involved in cell wall biosynthesis
MSVTITIAIPTRNRLENLDQLLNILTPQLDTNCDVLIIDNNSDSYSVLELENLIGKYNEATIRLIINPINIGADANLLKCIEHATGDWIALLGDSKLVLPDAVKTMRDMVYKNLNASFINFYFPDKFHAVRNKTQYPGSCDEFINNLDSFGNMLLVGNTIYRRIAALHALPYSYSYINTRTPHIALAYYSLIIGPAILSHRQVIQKMLPKPNEIESPSVFDCWISFSNFPSVANSISSQTKLKKLITGFETPSQPLWWLIYGTLKNIYDSNKKDLYLNIYKNTIFNLFFSWSKTKFILLFYLPSLWLIIPFNKKLFLLIRNKFRKISQ